MGQRSEASTDPADLVHTWQRTSAVQEHSSELGITGRLFQASVEQFSSLLKAAKCDAGFSSTTLKKLRSTLSLFILWGDGFGALDGDLDAVIQTSPRLCTAVLSLLVSITETISKRLQTFVSHDDNSVNEKSTRIASGLIEEARGAMQPDPDDPDDEAEADSDSKTDSLDDGIDDIEADLSTYVQCLMDLEAMIKRPVPDILLQETVAAPSLAEEKPAYQYYADLIRERFSKASPTLIDQLGRVSWDRYQRVQMERQTNMNQAEVITGDSATVITESAFHDSGVGTSLQTATSYAKSIASFISSTSGGKHNHIPPLSPDARKGIPFVCDACGKTVQISRTRDWRKHLHKDLEPYVCPFESCEHGRITLWYREVWTEHLGSAHGLEPDWASLICPMCNEWTGQGRSVISLHLAKHMEEIAMDAMPRGSDSDVDSEVGSDATNYGYDSGPESLSAAPPIPTVPTTVHSENTYDTTGQIAPSGANPHVTATLWEDEGTLCFQVDARGVCVARREDNHMVNGTKLLNVAGMTRGRRDGILKSEKVRHVVKDGPMHLKGVWIPYDRALDFANKERITHMLYPLFVHDIGALLHHPSNPTARVSARTMPNRPPNVLPKPSSSSSADPHSDGGPIGAERPKSHSQTQQQGASSYWSAVDEVNFRVCLRRYGNDFDAIASVMRTKTKTMLENHYQEYLQDGDQQQELLSVNDRYLRPG